MTPTPTERRLAITPGTWTAQNILRFTRMGRMPKVVGPDGQLIVEFMGGELGEVEDNALLIADAGTTYNACGLTPSELLAKLKQAEDVVVHMVSAAKYHFKHGNDTNLDKQTDIADAFLSTLNLPQ